MTHQEMQLSCCRCSGLYVSFTRFQMAASAVTQMTSSFNCVMDRERVKGMKEEEEREDATSPSHLPAYRDW